MKELTVKRKLYFTGIFSLLFLLFYVVLLPHFDVSDLKNHVYSLDIRSSYSTEYVRWLFAIIGSQGLLQYQHFLIADFFYLAVYGILAYLVLGLLITKMGRLGQILRYTVYAPAFLMLADFIENIDTYCLILNADNLSDSCVQFGSSVTTIKWLFASIVVAIIVCYAFYAVLRFVFWKLKNNKI